MVSENKYQGSSPDRGRWPSKALAASLVNVIDGYVYEALPMLERAGVALIARPARKPPFHDDIFAAEWPIAITAGRAKNGNDGRAD